jgi:hypothetical protein
LSCKATFAEKIALVKNADGGFLPALRYDRESYLPGLNIENSVGRVTLDKDRLLFCESHDLPSAVDGRKEFLGIEFAAFLGRCYGCHDLLPPQELRKDTFPNDMDEGMYECGRRAGTTLGLAGKRRAARRQNDSTLGVESQMFHFKQARK